MEALKGLTLSTRPLRLLFHLSSSSSLRPAASILRRRSYRSTLVLGCASPSSSSSPAAATVVNNKAPGRNRRNAASSTSTSDREAVRAIRIKKVEELRGKGLEPYAYKWDKTHTAAQLQDIYRDLGNGEELNSDNDRISVAGRIVARRAFGKLAFLTLRDESGSIQLYCEKERLSDEEFEQLKAFVDIGDILGATGSIKRT